MTEGQGALEAGGRPWESESEDALRQRLRGLEHRAEVLEYPAVGEDERRQMLEHLLALERRAGWIPEDSPTQRLLPAAPVGARRRHASAWVDDHALHGVNELRAHHQEWAERSEGEISYVATGTVRGMEVALRYEQGRLVSATTRGDGEHGLDVTERIRALPTVPLRLFPAGSKTESRATKPSTQGLGPSTLTPTPPFPAVMTVRATVTLRVPDLVALDRRRIDAGEPPFVHADGAVEARLLGAGLDPTDLRVYASEVLELEGIDSRWQMIGALKSWGFAVIPLTWRCRGFQEVIDFVNALQQVAGSFELPLEGGRLAVNRLVPTEGAPPAVARLVFPPGGRPARVVKVYEAVGRTGAVLPVAQLAKEPEERQSVPDRAPLPVVAGGLLAVEPGDSVRVRPGGVAPVIGTLDGRGRPRPEGKACPHCAEDAASSAAGLPFVVCRAERCPGRERALLLHLVGPRGLQLPMVGPRLVDLLLSEHGALDLPALLGLSAEAIERHAPGQGDTFARQIARHRALPLWKAVQLAAVPGVGEHAARAVAHQAFTVGRFVELQPPELEAMEGLGRGGREGLAEWIPTRAREFFDRLSAVGATFVDGTRSFPAPLLGKRVVVDGRFEVGGAHVVDEVERRGGRVQPRVGRTTDLAVLGARSDKTRNAAAMYGVPVLDEVAWARLRVAV